MFDTDRVSKPLKIIYYAVAKRARKEFAFPIDMLRYDRCFPLREIDSMAIIANISISRICRLIAALSMLLIMSMVLIGILVLKSI